MSAPAASLTASLCEILILLFVFSLFIPEAIAAHLGEIKLTPTFAIAILLFPLLLIEVRSRLVWPDLLVIAMFTSFFISTWMSSPLGRTVESMGRLFLIAAVPYMAGRFILENARRTTRTLSLLVTLLAVMGTFAVLESLFRFNIHDTLWGLPYTPHKETRLGLTRAHGWTSHAIMFGIVNAVFLPIILVAAMQKVRFVGRAVWIKFVAIGTGCFLSLSTGAWLPAFVAIMFVIWDRYAPVQKKILWPLTFGGLIGGFFLLEVLSNRPLLRILMMRMHLTSDDAWYYRWRLYERVYDVMPGNWWLGHGLALPDAFAQGFQSSVDNHYLVLLLHNGRIGLFLWIAVAVSVIAFGGKAVWSTNTITPTVRLTRAMSFSLIGLLLTQLSVALFSTPAIMYWMMMGLIISGSLKCRSEHAQIQKRGASKKRRLDQQAPNTGNRNRPRGEEPSPANAMSGQNEKSSRQ